ncbi:hypothetical protein H5410_020205 [Solanum commersonii]|uniref:Reverse transcriptase n=1 Tax=Solanum commersonii TaxID=4109 RepID=A0A9J5ZBS2_SOLCO|nr:hypothetical protein H5410_020205 [Solanum commersonii]
MKWRLASGLLCVKKVPPKFKGKFYRMMVRSSLLYGVECWPIKNSHVQHIADIRSDKIRNEVIREKTRDNDTLVRRCERQSGKNIDFYSFLHLIRYLEGRIQ